LVSNQLGWDTLLASSVAKERGKFASFAIHERRSLPVVEHYFIVLTAYALFPDWKIGAK
jgi:hypothetical protein